MQSDGKIREKLSPAQWTLIGVTIAITAASLAYRLLARHRLEQSAALFIGLPALLAILLALTPKQKSITGGIVKGLTFFLLLSGPLLGEGFLCILMAAPIFYAVGVIVGALVDWSERRRNVTLGCLAIFVLPMCLEGVLPQLTWNRMQTVEVTRTISASTTEVERALFYSPRLGTPLPHLLRIGFPIPLSASGDGIDVGATRTIRFSGAEGHPPGDLVMRAMQRREGFASFTTVSDDTKLTHWMEWKQSEVDWHAVDAAHTRVTWRIVFERRLDPAWYFTPLERAAVHEAARFMIEANATPATSRRGRKMASER